MKIQNRSARLKYRVLDSQEAGIILTGAEVKSLRGGRADLSKSFARIQGTEMILKNLFIPPYHGDTKETDPRRDRKLLLKKRQITDLKVKLSKKGLTLVPLSIYFTRNFAKVELSLAQAKSEYDHRRDIKQKEQTRQTEQELKKFNV